MARKRKQFDINSIEVDDSDGISSKYIQISVDEAEIARRIECFVNKKRTEINVNNIIDYTNKNIENQLNAEEDEPQENTCARINSSIVKQESSQCHLRVYRTDNWNGPQVRPDYLNALDKLMITESKGGNKNFTNKRPKSEDDDDKEVPHGINERLLNMEEHLNLANRRQNKDIFGRLRDIEQRLIYLESVSPEYQHFLQKKINMEEISCDQPTNQVMQNLTNISSYKMYPVDDIDNLIESLTAKSKRNS